MSKSLQNKISFFQLVALLQNVRQQVLRTLNSMMTCIYFELFRLYFKLTWLHYRFQMQIEDENERRFCVIESEKYSWRVREFKRQYDEAQMQMDVNYYNREKRLEGENKTIGIAMCQNKSDLVVDYTLPENNEQIFASKYKTVLPSKEDLIKLIS